MTARVALLIFALMCSACASTADDAATESSQVPSVSNETSTNAPTSADEPSSTGAVTVPAIAAQASTTSATSTTVIATTTRAPLPSACGSEQRVAVGLQTGSFISGGVEYKFQWTIPSGYDGSPLPVVLDFHGIGSNGAQQAIFSGWGSPAFVEAQGFFAIEPTGVNVAPDDRASWELPQFETDERDDIAMVEDLLELAAATVCIDQNRIYATGMSNGGLFTSTLVCELSDRIAAAVSVAGVTHDASCSPSRAVPYLAFHGVDDTIVPFNGGGIATLGDGGSGEFFDQVMPDEFAEFASGFGCTESVDSIISAEVTLTSWVGCDDDNEMGFYTIDGAGHTWPGSAISAAIPSLGVTNMDIDATAIAWEFFQRHTL